MGGGKALGFTLLVLVVLVTALTVYYTDTLEEQRQEAIGAFTAVQAECKYDDESLCPQAVDNFQVPDSAVWGLVVLGILLAAYLFRSDVTQRKILSELEEKRAILSQEERRELLMRHLKDTEKSVMNAVLEQPGITQATLKLRVDMSKSKLSQVLSELEERGLIKKEPSGRTNAIHSKI